MELIEKSILVLDDVMGVTQVSQLLKYANSVEFGRAVTVGEIITNEKDSHRETKNFPLSRFSVSLSNVHWYNFIANKFKNSILTFQKSFPYFRKKGNYVFRLSFFVHPFYLIHQYYLIDVKLIRGYG